MEVILLEDVQGLGRAGDIKEVKPGYARNFLLPNKFALVSTAQNKKVFEARRRKTEVLMAKQKDQAEALAEKLSQVSCTIAVKVGEEEKLFGSVTSADIAKALEQQGFSIDKKDIHLDDPIKNLGVYQVTVKLYAEVSASIKVWVVKE